MVPGHINHSDDELAFLPYYPLLRYERDAALLAIYKDSLERSWQIERPERNPLWNVIRGRHGSGEFDRETLRTLREIPMDMVEWDDQLPAVRCADRSVERPTSGARRWSSCLRRAADVEVERESAHPRWRQRRTQRGRRRYFLLPYWMGRFHGLIE